MYKNAIKNKDPRGVPLLYLKTNQIVYFAWLFFLSNLDAIKFIVDVWKANVHILYTLKNYTLTFNYLYVKINEFKQDQN